MAKKIAYVGPEGGGVHLDSPEGLRMPWGETVSVPDAVHAEFLANRPGEFEDREIPAGKASKKAKEVDG